MASILSNITLLASMSNFEVIDLTHAIDEKVCVWDGSCGFAAELTGDYDKGGFRGHKYTMRSCLGTHIDLPAHCFKNAPDAAQFSLKNCFASAYVIDVAHKAHEDYKISADDIKEFEARYGQIKPGSLVFFSTGWSKRWHNPIEFRNEKNDGIAHFPFVSEEATQLLLKRDIMGIGVDTFSPDAFYVSPIVHKLLLGSGKCIIECVANLEQMPPINTLVIALPLKIKGGGESPIRLVALKEKK